LVFHNDNVLYQADLGTGLADYRVAPHPSAPPDCPNRQSRGGVPSRYRRAPASAVDPVARLQRSAGNHVGQALSAANVSSRSCPVDRGRVLFLKAAIPRHRSALWWASTKELRHAQATAVAPRGRGGSHLGGPVQLQAQPGAEPVTRDGGCTHVSTDLAAETPEQAEEAQHQARAAGRGREPVNGSSFTCDAGS
jgi:hypothetical protein